jgi:hypothetical protein
MQHPQLVDEEWFASHAQQRLWDLISCRPQSRGKATSENGHGPIRQVDVVPSRRH